MKLSPLPLLTVAGMVALAGCAATPESLGPAGGIVATSLQSMGGHAAWSRVRRVDATAVVTIYDDAGTAIINTERYAIDVNGGKLTAEADTPRGRWKATVTRGGRCRMKAEFPMDETERALRCRALRTVLHRSAGPLNLLHGDAPAELIGPRTLDGENVVRVDSTHQGRAVSYYFLPNTGELRFLTARPSDDRPGNVTIYTHEMLPRGMAFCKHLRVMEMGETVSVGRKPLLDVVFQDVKIH